MTTTAEFRVLLDAFDAAYGELTALTNARAEKLGLDPTVTPVPIDTSHEEIIAAHARYEDAWQKVSKAADTLWQKEPAKGQSPKRQYRDQVADEYDPYDIDQASDDPTN
jgi:hypothetical protein